MNHFIVQLKMLILRFFRKDIQTRYPKYKIGKNSYGNPEIINWGEDAICEIGAFCSIAPGVKIFLGGEHRSDWITTYPFSIFRKSA